MLQPRCLPGLSEVCAQRTLAALREVHPLGPSALAGGEGAGDVLGIELQALRAYRRQSGAQVAITSCDSHVRVFDAAAKGHEGRDLQPCRHTEGRGE